MSNKPLMIDLFCGLGGWSHGGLAEEYEVIGFDIERWPYLGQLVLQDVRSIDGARFRNATVIVASPPCQFFSYTAMPWTRAKELAEAVREDPDRLNSELELFNACFRIQREASEAAGRKIPLIVENVKGAQKWVGPAKWHYGSYYLWGDVPALMPFAWKVSAKRAMDDLKYGQRKLLHSHLPVGNGPLGRNDGTERAIKNNGGSWFNIGSPGQKETNRNPVHEGVKVGNDRFFENGSDWMIARGGPKSSARKAASALIAKIPFPLANFIARVYDPRKGVIYEGDNGKSRAEIRSLAGAP